MKTTTRIARITLSLGTLVITTMIMTSCDQAGAEPVASVSPVAQVVPAQPPKQAPTPAASQQPTVPPWAETDGSTAQQPVAPSKPVDPALFIVKVEPGSIDFGEIPTNDTTSKVIRLVNTGDTEMNVVAARASCGCTALDVPPNTKIGPRESRDVKVQLSGGAVAGPLHGKKVTFVVEGQPDLEVPIVATAVSYVTQDPASLSPEKNPDGKVTLKSRDGTPFRIISMQPPLLTDFGGDAKTEHVVNIDWVKYRETGISRKTMFYFDHPKCQSLMVNVQFSQEDLIKEQERLRAQAPQVQPNPNPNQMVPPAAMDPAVQIQQMIAQGRNDEVLKKIAEGTDVNLRDAQGTTLLAGAAKNGNVDLLKALINAKADINATDNAGRTALMHAATSKNVEAVRALLDAGINVSAKDTIGGTALTWACGFGDPTSVKELLDVGAEVDTVGRVTGWTPLIWASGFGDPQSIKLLVDLGANIEIADFLEGATPLIHASRTGKVDSIKELLKAGAKLETADLNGKTPLLAAAANSGGDSPKVQALLDAGANVHAKDNRGMNALQLARKRTDPRAADVLKVLEPILASETPADAAAVAAPAPAKTVTPAPAPSAGAATGSHEGHAHEKPGN